MIQTKSERGPLLLLLAATALLLLLDEPFSALDTGLRSAMRKMVARLLEDAGVTTILVTHDQSEALSFADQLAVMRAGRLVQFGHPMDLYRYPDDEQTAHFLGEAVVLPARIEAGGRTAIWVRCRSTATALPAPRTSCFAPNNCRSPTWRVTVRDVMRQSLSATLPATPVP